MSHRDWKGPGFYDCWDSSGRWQWSKRKAHVGELDHDWTYKKLEHFEPPKPPKPELQDGVYWVIDIHGETCLFTWRESKWCYPSGTESSSEPIEILGRIPIEPVE
jgi:hypothetical protein